MINVKTMVYQDILDTLSSHKLKLPNERFFLLSYRGSLPVGDIDDYSRFRSSHKIIPSKVDYRTFHCSFFIVDQIRSEFAVFTGNTVPHINNVAKAAKKGGKGANQMAECYLIDGWFKRQHNESKNGHHALGQNKAAPYQRTFDDLDYDTLDPYSFGNVSDNLHSSYSWEKTYSGGCGTIRGHCTRQNDFKAPTGDWAIFAGYIYGMDLKYFTRLHLDYKNINKKRLIVGSTGEAVKQVQVNLNNKGFRCGTDGAFGPNTWTAVMKFQKSKGLIVDGIVGEQTLTKLMPNFNQYW